MFPIYFLFRAFEDNLNNLTQYYNFYLKYIFFNCPIMILKYLK